MLLRRLVGRAGAGLPVGSVVIRSTRRGAPYSHTAVGVSARLEPGALGAGGGPGSRAGGRRLLPLGAGGLHPGATRFAASSCSAPHNPARRAANFPPRAPVVRRRPHFRPL